LNFFKRLSRLFHPIERIIFGRKVKMRMLVFFLILHSFFLTAVSIYLLNLPYIYEDELYLVQATSIIKKLTARKQDKPDRKRFLFVNVAWEKQLIEKLDKEGFPLGNQAITNRKKLAEFLNRINNEPVNHKYLLCDINFIDPSENDEDLQQEFDQLKNYITSYTPVVGETDSSTILNTRKAVSGYETYNVDKFIKFKLIQTDSLKSIPLIMYEDLHQKMMEIGDYFFRMDSKFVLNSFIVDFKIWSYDLSQNSEYKYDIINLGDFDFLPDSAFKKLTNNRIIIIGDYEVDDIHETIYGRMSGPLILLNTFLALENEDNVLSPFFVLYLFICFFIISGYCLDFETRHKKKLYLFKVKNHLVEEALGFLAYLFLLALVSSISFFLFNIHLTILLFASYLYFLDFWNKHMFHKHEPKPELENIFYSMDG
jgi:hypothetical protein